MAIDLSSPATTERPVAEPRPAMAVVPDNEVSLLDFLIIIAQRKRIVIGLTLSCAMLAVIISLLLPMRYTATSAVLPPQQNSSMGSLLASQLGSIGSVAALAGSGLGIKNPNDMLVAMIKSRTVEDAMVERFGLMQEYHSHYPSDARKSLEKNSIVDGSGKDGLIRISVKDPNPDRAAQLANGYVDQFRRLSENLAITEASQRRLFFEQQLESAKNKLADAEEALTQTEQRTGLIQLDSQTRALIESAASLKAQIAAKQVQIDSLQTFATDENAQLVQAREELQGLQEQLAKLGGSQNDSDVGLIVPRGKVPKAGLEYIRKLREVRYQETIFDILARQFELAKLDEAKQGALIQVVDTAIPPDRRSSPKRALIVIVATVFGLFAGICSALFQNAYRRMQEDIQTEGKLRLLREVLVLRRKHDSQFA
jgi:tyrosine-protein kinase Etk/Wzc